MADPLPPLTSQSQLKSLAVLKGHDGVVNDLSWSPDGKHIATASKDEAVFVWDVAGLTRPSDPDITKGSDAPLQSNTIASSAVIRTNHQVRAVAWSGDGSLLAIAGGYDGSVMLWSPRTRSVVATLNGHKGSVTCLSWSPDSKQLASSSKDNQCKVWDVAQRAVAATLRGNAEGVNAVAFCPDGLHIATGGDDRKTRVWSIVTEELCANMRADSYSINGVAWSPAGGQLAALDCVSSVLLWDVRDKTLLHTLKGDNIRIAPTKLSFSPDGRLLAVPRGERVRLLDVARWSEVAELHGHAGQVTAAAFSPDGSLVATASEDGTARVWGTASVQL